MKADEVAVADLSTQPPLAVPLATCECGYRLRGLPQRGSCPECGVRYGPTVELLLFGRPRGRRAIFGNWLTGGTSYTFFPPWLIIVLGGHAPLVFRIAGWGLLLIPILLFVPMRLFFLAQGSRARARCSPEACVQSDLIDLESTLSIFRYVLIAMFVGMVGWYLAVLFGIDKNAEARIALLVAAAIVAPGYALVIFLRKRIIGGEKTANPFHPEPEIDAGQLFPGGESIFPWSMIDRVTLEPAGPGRYHLRITHRSQSWFWRRDGINLEIEATAEEAAFLEAKLARWRATGDVSE